MPNFQIDFCYVERLSMLQLIFMNLEMEQSHCIQVVSWNRNVPMTVSTTLTTTGKTENNSLFGMERKGMGRAHVFCLQMEIPCLETHHSLLISLLFYFSYTRALVDVTMLLYCQSTCKTSSSRRNQQKQKTKKQNTTNFQEHWCCNNLSHDRMSWITQPMKLLLFLEPQKSFLSTAY